MTEAARQLALDLPFAEGFTLSDFLEASSNRAALEAVLGWPRWPSVALLLDGPEGCGKTHLASIWAQRAQAVVLEAADLWEEAEPLGRLGRARAALVEHADEVADERQLFHLYNSLAERRGHLLLTARTPLAAWGLRLPDLRSRLATAWTVHVEPPDETLLAALLVKQFADRQLRVEPGVIDYLLSRMERSFASARRLVEGLDRASLRARRPIGLALAREVLASLEEPDDSDVGMID
ncbi:DnaA/Hda family protein [Geminicoccaceae bacterium 1502E]|nr:DnaA/Hda family protein [Geminicoccaceae bacterium 1502E]